MIHTYSPTIRRKEMEAVLTCMVDEKIGPGDMNVKLIQTAKELIGFDGAVALRSPAIAFEYIFKALDFSKDGAVIFSALAPAYPRLSHWANMPPFRTIVGSSSTAQSASRPFRLPASFAAAPARKASPMKETAFTAYSAGTPSRVMTKRMYW